MRTVLFALLLLGVVAVPYLVGAQEVYIRGGETRETGATKSSQTYSYGVSYFQGFGENLAWSIGYLNEGHFPNHKRDGLDFQGWARINVLNRRLSLGVGVGPYLYWDTVLATTGPTYSDQHGVGAIFSAAANWYTDSRFIIQGKVNYVVTANSINTLSATIGLGYQLDKQATPGPATGPSPAPVQDLKNEVTFFAGRTVANSNNDSSAPAEYLQYRRNLAAHVDWTVGWLNEHNPISRTGPATEIWAGRTFLNDRFGLEIGVGPYLAYDSSGPNNVTKLDWLVSLSSNIRFTEHWILRATWHRVTTTNNRDSDIFLAGIGYRF
ncbi:MAG TPA: hypothetical protein VMT71_01245 [Syntrophorhabdales bacterium]|nr:hypothetical protein [Syntrophorhabdales bacterium]